MALAELILSPITFSDVSDYGKPVDQLKQPYMMYDSLKSKNVTNRLEILEIEDKKHRELWCG
jgi:hypothetical protein